MGFDWDEYKSTSDWVTFDDVGDKVVGQILAIRPGKDFNGQPCPELVLRTDEGDKTLTAGQKVLKALLADEQPQVGDRIAIVYSGIGDAKPGKAPAKLFDVSVDRANGAGASSGQPSASELL